MMKTPNEKTKTSRYDEFSFCFSNEKFSHFRSDNLFSNERKRKAKRRKYLHLVMKIMVVRRSDEKEKDIKLDKRKKKRTVNEEMEAPSKHQNK